MSRKGFGVDERRGVQIRMRLCAWRIPLSLVLWPAALVYVFGLSSVWDSAGAEVLSGHVERRGKLKDAGENEGFDALEADDSEKNPQGKRPEYGSSGGKRSGYRAEPNGRFGQGGPFFNPSQAQGMRNPADVRSPVGPPPGKPQMPVNSFPATFLGRWHCETNVINSYVRDIEVGTKMVSVVNFIRRPDGRIAAEWVQPGWTESQAYAIAWSDREARVDRTCYYFADGMRGAWASRSRDHFIMQNTDRMTCKSYIDQYIDGRYLGRYRTVSVLTRIGE